MTHRLEFNVKHLIQGKHITTLQMDRNLTPKYTFIYK